MSSTPASKTKIKGIEPTKSTRNKTISPPKKKQEWPTNPSELSIKHFPKLIKGGAPIRLILLNSSLRELFHKNIQKQKKDVFKYLRYEQTILELIEYVLCRGVWKGEEDSALLCELSTEILTLECDVILDSLVSESALLLLFCFYESHEFTMKVAQSGKYPNIDITQVPNNMPYFDKIILHALDKKPQEILGYFHKKGADLLNNLLENYLYYSETGVLLGEIIFQEERMRVRGEVMQTRWRGWYIEHDLITRMQQRFVTDPDKFTPAFSEFTRILSTFPAQSLSHQFFFEPLYEKNLFPIIFIQLLGHPSSSSEVFHIIFYFWQMALRAGVESQSRFVNKVGEISQNNCLRNLIKSKKPTVTYNTLKMIELLLAEAGAVQLVENTILDILDIFFDRKMRNVDHWSITVILNLVFNQPSFQGPFLSNLFQNSRLLERIVVAFKTPPELKNGNLELLPYLREVIRMFPEDVKTLEWKAVEPMLLREPNCPDCFFISDELRSRYQKNSRNMKLVRGLKNVLDELELVK